MIRRPKASKVRYSRWDGTQVGFELDADSLLNEMNDDLLYHGDLNAALRRMMNSGFDDRNGERIQGMKDLMEKLRQSRRERLEQYDLGGVYDDIAQQLRDVVDMERSALDQLQQASADSGDARRKEVTDDAVAERRMELDLLPPDLAGMVKELGEYDFTSSEARERFEELTQQLRDQLAQRWFNEMAGAMSDVSPEALARTKDMLAELNQMLQDRAAGQGAGLRRLHGALRRLLPGGSAEPRRAARDHGPAHGRHAGDAQLDDAGAAGAAPGPVRAAARGHGPAAGRWTSCPPTCSRRSRTWAGTAATTSRARTRSGSPTPPRS